MSAGFPITIGKTQIRTSEALYQVFRFPDYPEIQQEILNQKSPMSAKMVAKKHLEKTRGDWLNIRVAIMDFAIHWKLFCNPESFRDLLVSTDGLEIVEKSRKDPFWGAIEQDDGTLQGDNLLGYLLMELRNKIQNHRFEPPQAPNGCRLLGESLFIPG